MSKKEESKNNIKDIDKLIDNTFESIKNIVDANTIIGSAIHLSNKLFVIPISKVSVGVVSGGGEFSKKTKLKNMSVGSSTGFTITPIGFVSVLDSSIQFISTLTSDSVSVKLFETLLDISGKILSKQGEGNEKN